MSLPVKMGSEDNRTDREGWLDWAAHSQWHFRGYFKYSFTFTAEGFLFSLPDGAQQKFTATVAAGGDADDIYRYSVTTRPMSWDEVRYPGNAHMTVIAEDGTVLFSGYPESCP